MSRIRKVLKRPSAQHKTLEKIIKALLQCHKTSNKDFFYEKTLTHEFYHQLRNLVPSHTVIPEFPVKNLIDYNLENERFDFFLYKKTYGNSDNLVLEFKKNKYNKNIIIEDLIKLEKVSKIFEKSNLTKSIRPIQIIFFTEPLNFHRYSSLISEVFSNSEIRIIATAPSICINSLHQMHATKNGRTALNIRKKCIVTNYQKIIDYKMIDKSIPTILHPRKNGKVKKVLLYHNNVKTEIDIN